LTAVKLVLVDGARGRLVCWADESPGTMIIERTMSAENVGIKTRRCMALNPLLA